MFYDVKRSAASKASLARLLSRIRGSTSAENYGSGSDWPRKRTHARFVHTSDMLDAGVPRGKFVAKQMPQSLPFSAICKPALRHGIQDSARSCARIGI